MITGRTIGQHYSPHFWGERNCTDSPRLSVRHPPCREKRCQGRHVALAYPTTARNPHTTNPPPHPSLRPPPALTHQKSPFHFAIFCLFIFTTLQKKAAIVPHSLVVPIQHPPPTHSNINAATNTSWKENHLCYSPAHWKKSLHFKAAACRLVVTGAILFSSLLFSQETAHLSGEPKRLRETTKKLLMNKRQETHCC